MAHKYIPKKRNLSPLEYAKKAAGDRAYERSVTHSAKDKKILKTTEDIVKRHGQGSRTGQEAIKKYFKHLNSPAREAGKKALYKELREDKDLIKEYGADAMQARGVGTTYPKVKRNMGGPAKKREKKSKVFSGDAYVKEVNHYKDM